MSNTSNSGDSDVKHSEIPIHTPQPAESTNNTASSGKGCTAAEAMQFQAKAAEHTATLNIQAADHAAKLRMQEAEHAATLQAAAEKRRREDDEAAEKRRREDDEAVQQRRAERVFQNKIRLMEAATENSLKKRKREDDLANEKELARTTAEETMKLKIKKTQEAKERADADEADDAEYVRLTKELYKKIRSRLQATAPPLAAKPFTPGYLEAFLEYKKIKTNPYDNEPLKQATLDGILLQMPVDYSLCEQTADIVVMEGFYYQNHTSSADERKKLIMNGYMAMLRIMADPFMVGK